MALSAPLQAWRDRGRVVTLAGRDIFYVDSGNGDLPIVVIHGFPGSSYDWAEVVPRLPGRVIAFDLPGYGLSDKSPAASYSLFNQADVVEHLLRHLGVERCVVLAHDMGDTVTAELASRANTGDLSFAIDQIVLTNGSIFIDLAQLTRGQRLTLALPDRRSLLPMPGFVLRRSLGESFTRSAPPPPGAIDGLAELIRYGGGDRLMPRLIEQKYGERHSGRIVFVLRDEVSIDFTTNSRGLPFGQALHPREQEPPAFLDLRQHRRMKNLSFGGVAGA